MLPWWGALLKEINVSNSGCLHLDISPVDGKYGQKSIYCLVVYKTCIVLYCISNMYYDNKEDNVFYFTVFGNAKMVKPVTLELQC